MVRSFKIQVKSAWFDEKRQNFVVDNRRTKTNRRRMVRTYYHASDFDFAIVYIEQLEVFYIIPVLTFISYSSEIHLVEMQNRQRRAKSFEFREAWHLLQKSSLSPTT